MHSRTRTAVLGLTAALAVAAGSPGCAVTDMVRNVGGNEAPALAMGAAIGLVALGIANDMQARRASEEEARIAQERQDQAVLDARTRAGDDYGKVDRTLYRVGRDDKNTTYGVYNNRTGRVEPEVVELPNEDADRAEEAGMVDASDKPEVPTIGGKTVVFTS